MKHKSYPILISGEIGSGKSTLAHHLANHFKRKYMSGSSIHKQLVEEKLKLRSTRKIEEGFWETKEGKKGMSLRAHQHAIDKEVDQRLLKFLREHPHSITDARLMPWMYQGKAIRIWLGASEKERMKRVAERGKLSVKEVRKHARIRSNTERKIWKELYGIQFGEDLHPFDLVLHNDGMTPHQTYQLVKRFLDARFSSEK
jgi:cytidylate kinase